MARATVRLPLVSLFACIVALSIFSSHAIPEQRPSCRNIPMELVSGTTPNLDAIYQGICLNSLQTPLCHESWLTFTSIILLTDPFGFVWSDFDVRLTFPCPFLRLCPFFILTLLFISVNRPCLPKDAIFSPQYECTTWKIDILGWRWNLSSPTLKHESLLYYSRKHLPCECSKHIHVLSGRQ